MGVVAEAACCSNATTAINTLLNCPPTIAASVWRHLVGSVRPRNGDDRYRGAQMKMTDVKSGSGTLNIRAVVLTADKFEDMELFVPYFRLLDAGARVDTASPTMDEIGGDGYSVPPDLLISDVDPDAYDLLIIPGGFPDGAPAAVRGIPKAQEIARSFFDKNKPVASICHGPWLLVSADLVRGRRLTSYWHDGVPEEIRGAGGLWEDAAVVVDGNLVTSRWPADLPAFTAEMVKLVMNSVAREAELESAPV